MKRIYEEKIVLEMIEKYNLSTCFSDWSDLIFQVLCYDPGETISSPLDERKLFQVVVEGNLSINYVRDDGSIFSLAQSSAPYVVGDMELFQTEADTSYAEALTSVLCLALPVEVQKERLLSDASFMAYVASGLASKIQMIFRTEAEPCSLEQRVINYLLYRKKDHMLRGIEKTAFQLHCSSRQLQRVLNQLVQKEMVVKVGKGSYKLMKEDTSYKGLWEVNFTSEELFCE